MEINDNLAGIIKSHVVDAVIYGNKCTPEDVTRLHKFIPNLHTDCSQILINKPPSDFLENSQRRSFSRCFEDNSAMQPGSFIVSPETPGEKNDCQIEIKYRFKFEGRALQRTAQKMLINTWETLALANRYPWILNSGSRREVAARLLGISEKTMNNVKRRWEQSGTIQTPTKKKPAMGRVLKTFDSFHNDVVRRIIREGYKNNLVLTFHEIYHKFKKSKDDTRLLQIELKTESQR
jgi:hypothetical protein